MSVTGLQFSGLSVQKVLGQPKPRRNNLLRYWASKAGFELPPFDAKMDWPTEIEEVKMEHYIAWMKSAYWISATFCPAISVPAGFTVDGLPVGIQIVGRYRDDLGVLQIAHAFEQATGFGRKRPATALS